MPGPVGVQFVNETPRIDGGNVLVNFVTMGSTDTVLCELGDYSVVEDCKSVKENTLTATRMLHFNHIS